MRLLKLDFDRPTQFQIMRAYFYLKYIGAKVFTFSTKKGWHFYAILPKDIDVKDELELRQMLGDDEGRIEFDEARIKLGLLDWVDTLFEEKYVISNKSVTKVHEEIPANPLYEPFYLRRTR